jgi:serine/threonine protein phosphatase PrpC
MNVVTKFAFATRVGYIPGNPYKVNQDAFILAPNILKHPATHYFGVCDGHGKEPILNIIRSKWKGSI